MSEEGNTTAAPLPEVAAPEPAPARPKEPEVKDKDNADAIGGDAVASAPEPVKEVATEVSAPVEAPKPETTNGEPSTSDKIAEDEPAAAPQDVEMKETTNEDEAAHAPVSAEAPAAGESEDVPVDTPASASKGKTPRRKSGGIPEHKGKKANNKKAAKARENHSDAKPGDQFFVRLKGYPLWPAIVSDETMLPEPIIRSRPVTAARPDGTYRPGYEDGGLKEKDRSFPMMYLHTNEFSWVPNYNLLELDPEAVADLITPNMKKDLASAHLLAAEQNDLDHYKEILLNFVESKAAEAAEKEAAREAARAAKKATKKATPKKSKAIADADGDVDMADASGEPDDEELEVAESEKPAKSKKRKPEEDAETPQRADSVKKPKTTIKLNTPKTNGTATPKSAKDSAAKSSKPKTKKATPKVAATPEVVAPKEPELTPEEKRVKKEKEILFLRHKLQKGLLTKDSDPKEEEMKQMSEFVTKLEGYADLEVSIIRQTKINKVLKAILKLNNIPKEEEFQFKPRSTALLDKWNKLLASEQGTPVIATATNGIGSEAKASAEETKASPAEPTNGIKEATEEAKVEEKIEPKSEEPAAPVEPVASEVKEAAKVEEAVVPPVEEPVKEAIVEPAPVESTA